MGLAAPHTDQTDWRPTGRNALLTDRANGRPTELTALHTAWADWWPMGLATLPTDQAG